MANTTTISTSARTTAHGGVQMRRALPILLTGAFLPVLDTFIVNVTLATIGRTLHAGTAQLELTVSGYGVAYACSLVAGGRLGDRFGRKRLFLIGMAAFTAMSVACGLSPNATTLIVFRILQGVSAALMFPQVLATIQAGFEGEERQRALGVFGATVGAAAAIGQILGGVLLSADLFGLSWRPVFLVNVPMGVTMLAIAPKLLPETKAPAAARVDVRGAIGLAAAIALILLPVTLGRASGWPLWTWICIAAAGPAVAVFVATQARLERSGRTPLLPPSLLRLRTARVALGAITVFACAIGGFMFVMAIVLQEGHGFSAMRGGLTMTPCALAFLAVALRTGRLVARYGAKALVVGSLTFGGGVALFGVVAAAAGDKLNVIEAAAPLVIAGMGWAACIVPLIGFVLADLPADRAGLAGGVLSTALQIGLASGASILGSVLFGVVGSHSDVGHWRTATLIGVGVIAALSTAAAVLCIRLRRGR